MLPFNRVLLAIAHADDELVTFGPLMFQELDITVVCLTKSSTKRWRELQESARTFGLSLHCLNAIDDPEKDIHDSHFVSEIGKLIARLSAQKGKFDAIITHDPAQGDLGAHRHHRSMGILATLAAENITPCIPVYYKYTDGFCDDPLAVKMQNAANYQKLVSEIARIYPDELNNLEPEKYPLPSILCLNTYAPGVVKKIAMQAMTDHSISTHDLNLLDDDPWSTLTSPYEIWKRESSARRLNQLVSSEKIDVVVDMGCGKALTWKKVFNDRERGDLRTFGFVGIDSPVYRRAVFEAFGEATWQFIPWVETEDSVVEQAPLFIPRRGSLGLVCLSFLQSIYYMEDKFLRILDQVSPDCVIIETGGELDDWITEQLNAKGFDSHTVIEGESAAAFALHTQSKSTDCMPLMRVSEQINIHYFRK